MVRNRVGSRALAGVAVGLVILLAGCQVSSEGPPASESTEAVASSGVAEESPPSPVKPRVVNHGPRDRNEVALTFDADMTNFARKQAREGKIPKQINKPLLAYLRETKTPSTMFVTGLWAKEFPDEVRRMGRDKTVTVANHTWDHLAWTSDCYGLPIVKGTSGKRDQVRRASDLLHQLTGEYPSYFRFPGLCHNSKDVKIVASEGETVVDWDVSLSDAFVKNPDLVAAGLAKQARPGSILLFHLNGGPNASATLPIVKKLLPALKRKGLKPVTLEQMLG